MNGDDSNFTPGPADAVARRVADREALSADQALAARDAEVAAADQVVSDADQAGSERDDADSLRDQQSADRDQHSADARRSADGFEGADATYEATRAARTASRVDRLATHASRTGDAESRLAASHGRDRNASRRDDAAEVRDERALLAEQQIAGSGVPAPEQYARLRELAATDRAAAAVDRARAAGERNEAAAERTHLMAELHSAYLDDLTGAFQRAMGRHALSLEMDRARRGDGRLVIVFVDVDGLKGVNDRAGHATGDLVLRTLVATMRASLRSFDPIVRFGGDEFVCAIGEVDVDEVDRRFSLIRESLYADTGVGISIGLAALAADETLEEVIARADAALLEAKRSRPA